MAAQQSELPIPMPEIPGYQPPEPKDQPVISAVDRSGPSTQPQWNAMYDDGIRNRSRASPESVWQTGNANIPGHGYGVVSQPYIVNMMHGSTLNNQQPLPRHPGTSSQPLRQHNQSAPHNSSNPHPSNSKSQQPKSSPNRRHAIATVQRRIAQPDWLELEVPSDGFGLFGEMLLCPIKVVLYILQDVFSK